MNTNIQLGFDKKTTSQAVIYLLFHESAQHGILKSLSLSEDRFKLGSSTWYYSRNNEPHFLIVGLGKEASFCFEALRKAAGSAGRAAEKEGIEKATIILDGLEAWQQKPNDYKEHAVAAWIEGWLLGTYQFDKYKQDKKAFSVNELVFAEKETPGLLKAAERGTIRAKGTALARDLANEPGNGLRPANLGEKAKKILSPAGVEVTVYEGDQLVEMQMSGLRAVGKGSVNPPAFIEMKYVTDESKPLIALVGKGITFDTGGISLKSGRDLSDMRLDMSGAAAVLGAMQIIVQSGWPVNVIGLIATAENCPDGGSMLPGDIIEYKNGLSVQVGNTDAEGRLVLADAIIRAEELGAREVLDIATLTGACAVALGDKLAGIWGDEECLEGLKRSSSENGDKVWPMPLEADYEESLSSVYADTSNISKGRYGGAITAALFLKKFVPEGVKWAHIDMAGPMEASGTKGYITAGATGFGARLLADYVHCR